MTKPSSLHRPGYADCKEARKRLRAIIGWGTRFGDLTPEQRQEAERRASEPLVRTSLDALALGFAPLPVRPSSAPASKPAIALVFDGRLRKALLDGEKNSTLRKASSHSARYKVGVKIRIEAPKGEAIGETKIVAVENTPSLSAADRDALRRVYGSRFNGPWVRLHFDPLSN